MMRLRSNLLALSLVLAASLLAAPAAQAFVNNVSAPITRSGSAVGTGSGTLVVADNGWAVAGVRAVRFRAPQANRSWRVRTILTSACNERGFDPAEDDPSTIRTVTVRAMSRWRTLRMPGKVGTLSANDLVKECPTGLVPGGTLALHLVIQSTSGATVGRSMLFAAG